MRRRVVGPVLLPLLLLTGGGCASGAAIEVSASQPAAPSPTQDPYGGAGSPGAGTGTSQGTATPVVDDLATGRARHVIRSSGVTATITYETRKPDVPWTASGEKPLRVEVKVSRPRKKVYLNRVSLRFATNDGRGDIPGPDPIVDSATNVTPGYLVAPPYSYVQSFAVPVVDPSTKAITLDLKLELVSLVDKAAKDYTKQTVTDSVTTALT